MEEALKKEELANKKKTKAVEAFIQPSDEDISSLDSTEIKELNKPTKDKKLNKKSKNKQKMEVEVEEMEVEVEEKEEV